MMTHVSTPKEKKSPTKENCAFGVTADSAKAFCARAGFPRREVQRALSAHLKS